jgi:hypothetical protein
MAAPAKYFEVNQLGQGIRCPILGKVEYREGFRSDRIATEPIISSSEDFCSPAAVED